MNTVVICNQYDCHIQVFYQKQPWGVQINIVEMNYHENEK